MLAKNVVTPLVVEMWATDRIVPYAGNPRRNDDAVERMISAYSEFGVRVPLLVRSNGELIDGHLRLKAAKNMNLPELPVIVCDDWSAAQVKAFRLLVNRSATWAEFDEKLLAVEMAELQACDYDLSLTGFDLDEIDELLSDPDEKADMLPEPSAHVITVPGDLWICAGHRVLCGDATSKADVVRLLADDVPPLMVTDCPYGVSVDPQWRERAGLGEQRQIGLVLNDDRCDWRAAYELFPGDVAYVWHAGVKAGSVANDLTNCGFEIRSQIIWLKQNFVISRGHYHWRHEPCYYVVRNGRRSHWKGDRKQSTIWEVASLNPFGGDTSGEPATGHSAQKPVELMRRPILNHTERGEVIYDGFLGSGTTLIAAELTNRRCVGIELAPEYVDLIIRRWQVLTKREAVLAGDGRTFQQIEIERIAARRALPQGD